MPRYISEPKSSFEPYVAALEQELRANPETLVVNELPATNGKPVLIESPDPLRGRIQVVAIWDDWSEVAVEDRNRIIVEAYRRVHAEEVSRLGMTLGLTWGQYRQMEASGFRVFD